MTRRWRPSLGFVLGGALTGTLALSFAGLVVLRYLGPEIGFKNAAILLALIITSVTGGLGWLMVRLLVRPIRALERFAADTRAGAGPVDPPAHFGTQETRQTAVSVIDMARTLQDREATIRSFTDHVTHELRTPVSAIRAAVELLEDSPDLTDTDRRLLAKVAGANQQIDQQLEALRRAARARESRYIGDSRPADLLDEMRAAHPGLKIAIQGETEPVSMAAEGVSLILSHLLGNAVAHGATSVLIDVGDNALSVTDDGPGISEGNRDRIFDPFFTTRRDSGGTGMGLTIVRNILTSHGGEITLRPSTAGTSFELRFARRGTA
ncbi:HAMP domain-containing sensor histidine kinase [Mesobacterium sp. TK19101]|uniref:histidine kinase n=1 Tax=Mesobacterium hydrothermale TaxID=3111907 RepID=A0ABU6HG85_9RHOB|nr:HAMP domain-containing sensor histidine kinase [Mesobacterium sp. TK19101]MEC3861311.1 HAMP domain-containing sensor histidine kinase [Mesobacterium sp. TK19101]